MRTMGNGKEMKAITLWQPWASLMATGLKKIETRSWHTRYRGGLLIHAAKKIVPIPPEIETYLEGISLPRGFLLCRVNLIDCRRINQYNAPDPPECFFGDYRRGRYMWITELLEVFDPPIAGVGQQGLWEW